MTLRQHTDVEKENKSVEINLSEPVSLTFSLKYLVNFCKAATLSEKVKICLSAEVPLLVEFTLTGTSHLRFYLAPKVCLHGSYKHNLLSANTVSRLGMMSKGAIIGATCLRLLNLAARGIQSKEEKGGLMSSWIPTRQCPIMGSF